MHQLGGQAILRAIVEASPAAMVALLPDHTVALWNPAAETLFGWRADEVVGRPFPLIPDDRAAELEDHIARIDRGETISTETWRRRKDGRLVEVHLSAAPIRDEETGAPAGWMAVYVDLTRQRRTEKALATRSGELEAVVQSFPDLYFWMSPENRIVDLRAGRTGDLYDDPETFLGLHPRDYLPRGPALAIEAAADRARETGEVQAIEYVLPIRGRQVPFEARFAVLPDRRVLLVVRNITARRETEQELRDSLGLLRAVVEGTPDAIFLKDTEGRYVMVNRAAAALLGGPVEQIVGRRDDEVLPPPTARQLLAEDRQVLADGRTRTFEIALPKPGEGARTVLTTKSVLRGADGRVTGLIGVGHDLTEHRRLEDQLRQSQKMEAIGRLAGGVAHDFNNLLTVILSSAELIERQLEEGAPARTEAAQIAQAAERAGELTRQLLAFSRRRISRPKPLDLCEIVRRDERMLRRLIGEHIHLRARVPDARCTVTGDPALLEQVLVNLVVNARDAMPRGGNLDLGVECVELGPDGGDAPPPGAYCRLTVTDTGTGMEPEVLAHVFEPFFTTKGPREGTGLGLSTVYGIVQQLGGRIDVSSTPGEGTTFRILLPKAEAPEARSPAATEVPRAQGEETLLLVEDEPAVRELTHRSLAGLGYQVLTARDGREALRLLEQHHGPVDLLVTDAVMPKMSGRELAERVILRRPHVKVLFVTGFSPDPILQDPRRRPGEALLEKPFTGETLARAVRSLLDEAAPRARRRSP